MRSIVVPNARRVRRTTPMPPVFPAASLVTQAVQRDQFGNVILRTVGGAK